MQKTLIATAFLSLFFLTTTMAQDRKGGGGGRRVGMQQDSARGPMAQFRDMEQVAEKDLPASLSPYIKQTYPNATVRRMGKTKAGKFVVVLTETDKPRRVLVADSKGEILQNREMPARNGQGGGRRQSNK